MDARWPLINLNRELKKNWILEKLLLILHCRKN